MPVIIIYLIIRYLGHLHVSYITFQNDRLLLNVPNWFLQLRKTPLTKVLKRPSKSRNFRAVARKNL